MKNALLIMLSVLLFSSGIQTCTAQKEGDKKLHMFIKKIENPGKASILKIGDLSGDLVISSHNQATVQAIEVQVKGYKTPPARAKGLRPLGSGGVDNTGVGLNYKQVNNVIELGESVYNNGHQAYHIKVPKTTALIIKYTGFQGGNILIRDINQEIEISAQSSPIKLENVTGPVVANTLGATIEAIFGKVNQDSPISITSTGGEIDITLPNNTPANLQLNAMGGNVFTDLDIDSGESKGRANANHNFSVKLNGGGVDLQLHSLGGNIYLRKAQ